MIIMSRIYDTDLQIDGTSVSQPGIHGHRNGTVITRSKEHIAVKWPRGNNHQRASGRSIYYPPVIMVFAVLEENTHNQRGRTIQILKVKHLLDWDAGRKQKQDADDALNNPTAT